MYGSARQVRVAGLVFATAVALATASIAQAAVTPVSTVSKTGRDATTGSTATGGGAAGTTAGGRTIDWTVLYRNTTGAEANVDLRDVFSAGQTYVPGSLKVPPGLTPRWSTDGGATFSNTEPLTGVNAVGATGTSVNGSTGEKIAVQPGTSGGFTAGNVGGDGWEALFIDNNVYNVHHHAGPVAPGTTIIDCHNKVTGLTCPGFPAGGTYVSEVAGQPLGTGANTLVTPFGVNGVANQTTGRIYFPAGRTGTTSIGVACMDVRALVSCGYTELSASAPFPSTNFGQISGGGVIGTRYYLADGAGRIYCFDTATQTPCPGLAAPAALPAPNAISAQGTQVEVFDNRYVWVNLALGDGNRAILCLDTTTGNACTGFPIIGYGAIYDPAGGLYNMPLAPILSPTGALIGICGAAAPNTTTMSWECFDLAGNTIAGDEPWTQRVAGTLVNWVAFGSIEVIGTKLYFAQAPASGVTTYTCWDFALGAAGVGAPCAGFVETRTGAGIRPYTLRQDPFAPDCVWVVGDAGIFEVFSATFGGIGCQQGETSQRVSPAAYYCDGSPAHVSAWRSLNIAGVTAADYGAVAVTLRGIDGTIVPGWNARVFPNTQQTIDISSIPITGNTASLQVTVVFDDLTKPATVTARFEGDPVQVCFQTRVAAAQCTATPAITNTATVVTTVPGGVTDAPGGNSSGTATFQVADNPAVCPPTAVITAPPPVRVITTVRGTLRIRKTANKRSVTAGGRIGYTIRVTNPTRVAVKSVRVCDRLPSGLAFVSSSRRATRSDGRYCWNLQTVAANSSKTVRLTVRALPGARGTKRNSATLTGRGVSPRSDRAPGVRVLGPAARGGGVTG